MVQKFGGTCFCRREIFLPFGGKGGGGCVQRTELSSLSHMKFSRGRGWCRERKGIPDYGSEWIFFVSFPAVHLIGRCSARNCTKWGSTQNRRLAGSYLETLFVLTDLSFTPTAGIFQSCGTNALPNSSRSGSTTAMVDCEG